MIDITCDLLRYCEDRNYVMIWIDV